MLGVQPDADRCSDAKIRALDPIARRRSGRPGQARRATTKSSVSRRFVALSTAKLKEWRAPDLSGLDRLVIRIEGLHVGDHVLVAAIGIDEAGDKHVLAVTLGPTENAAVVKALITDLIERGPRPDIVRLFIVDGAKALSRAVSDTFGGFVLIQRSQVHKGRNIIEQLDPSLHAGVKKVLRQAWDSPTAEQAERVLRNPARWLDYDAPGVSASILEGLDKTHTVIRLGLPDELRRSLSCINAIESLMAVLRQVSQRQTLARCTDGVALGRARYAGGREELHPLEGPQAAFNPERCVAAPSTNAARRPTHWHENVAA